MKQPCPAAQFASGMLFDTMPGGPELARFADQASNGFENVSDDELLGILCAWGRVQAHAAARKYAAVAELIRRRPAAGWPEDKATGMPQVWDEFTPTELSAVLAESKGDAAGMLGLADDLEVKLPGTRAGLSDGILSEEKVAIIARATAVLTPQEARAAEALVLDRAGRLTPGALRPAIARAVIEVAPTRRRNAGNGRLARPGWNAGPRSPATRAWPAGSCPLPRYTRPTSGSAPGPGSSSRLAWTDPRTNCGPAPSWTCYSAPTPVPDRAALGPMTRARARSRPGSSATST